MTGPDRGAGIPPTLRRLLWTTLLFCGLLAAYGGLTLAARGRPAAALAAAAGGLGVALAGGWLLERDGGRR